MMSARDIATIINRIRKAEKDMTDPDPDVMSLSLIHIFRTFGFEKGTI